MHGIIVDKFIDFLPHSLDLIFQVIESLRQSTRDKLILYTNLLIIVTGAIGFYVYFSINPFSQEEISNLQEAALKNITRSIAKQVDIISS